MHAAGKVFRVLFLCTGNSARSQIAEQVLKRKGRGRFVAESAGSHPAAQVNPYAIETLERHGYFWMGGRPRGLVDCRSRLGTSSLPYATAPRRRVPSSPASRSLRTGACLIRQP